MSKVDINLDRIESNKTADGRYLNRTVVYAIYRGDLHFEVPIEVDATVEEDQIMAEARAKLHQVLQDCVEELAGA